MWPSSVQHASQHPGGLGVVFADLGPSTWVGEGWGGLVGTAPRLQSGPFLSLSSEMLAQRVQVRSPASPPCFQQGAAEAAAGSWLGNCQAGGWRAAMQIPSPQAVRPTPGSPRTSTARQNPRDRKSVV